MKAYYKHALLCLFGCSALFFGGLGSIAHAALVTCGNSDTVTNGLLVEECRFCDLQVLALNILNFLVLATTIVAALMFLNAGVLYIMSSANPGNIAKAHKIFGTTLVGMIIVFAAWLIINQIMVILHEGSPQASMGQWDAILDCGDVYAP